MDASSSLLERIEADFPSLHFKAGDDFEWSPSTSTIMFIPDNEHLSERLLHELAHAELSHANYHRDVELIAMERDAWEFAKTSLAPRYETTIPVEIIDKDMDTYRDWLHARSTCPACSATGIQTADSTYTCVACRTSWHVNQAKGCALRRTITKTPL